jgi:hypothetical protein
MHSRRLARKRRDRRQILYDTSTDDEGKICRRIEDNNDDGDTQREQSYHDPPMGCCSAIGQLSNASQHTREKAAEVESSPKNVEGEHDGGEEMRDSHENTNESENSDMDMERSPSVTEGATNAKHVEAEEDGGEEMRDSEENINKSENSAMDMERSPSVSKGGTSATDVEGEQDGREQMRDSEENMNSRTDMQPPPSVSVNNKDKANCATSNDYNTLTTRYSSFTPPAGWVLNDDEYVDKVANYIECSLYKDLKKGHLHSFLQRRDRAQSRQTHADRQFWEKADPEIDAWMLATGRVREVFNIEHFVKRHPDIFPALQRLRKDLNVLVLQSRCPVNRALNANTNNDEQSRGHSFHPEYSGRHLKAGLASKWKHLLLDRKTY